MIAIGIQTAPRAAQVAMTICVHDALHFTGLCIVRIV